MQDSEANYDMTTACEGSEELNGKDASYLIANMTSAPRLAIKQRIRRALVPLRRVE